VQDRPLGTGDSLRAAREKVGDSKQLLVVSGDHPRLSPQLLQELVDEHRASGATVTVLSFEPPDPRAYGRIVRDGAGRLEQIVENADADEAQREVREVNSSIYVFQTDKLWPALDRIEPVNAQGELYLTDAVRLLVEDGEEVAVFKAPDAGEVEGVNTRVELADAAGYLRARVNKEHMLAGVTIVDPQTTWIEPDVELAPDSTIHPFTILRGKTRVAAGAEVGPHVVAVDAEIGPDATVGPFAYLRPGTVLGEGVHIGTYVELKKADVGAGTKIPHLSYVGDATIGEHTNIGAASVFVNYDGVHKHHTTIGSHARTGADNMFVAPVTVGDGAYTAAGSVIIQDVPPGAMGVARAQQRNVAGWVLRKRSGTPAAEAAERALAADGEAEQ
jgi:bifunctional UDP-N-acetylglucosamine pyrophosphorylase/glucosamine-1-phosphate N-acetyltransferase